jgi:chromosome segregation ATPase
VSTTSTQDTGDAKTQAAAISVAEMTERLRAARTRLAGLRAEQESLERTLREARNWLNGYQMSDSEATRDGILGAIREKRGEVDSLNTALTTLKRSIQVCKEEIDALDAMRFNEEEQLEYALNTYIERQTDLNNLRAREKSLRADFEEANRLLTQARGGLVSAQAARSHCTVLADIAAAGERESAAHRRLADIELLAANLKAALNRIPAEAEGAGAALRLAEEKVWEANCNLAIRDIQTLAGYTEIMEALKLAFVSWVASGRRFDFGVFLTDAAAGGGAGLPGPEYVAMHKAKLAKTMKLG